MENLKDKIITVIKTGFLHIFGSSVINKIIAFLSTVVLVRILTKEEYGVFTYAWNIYSIVIMFNGLGMEASVLQLGSENSADVVSVRRISNYCSRFGLLFDLLLAVVLLVIGFFVPLKIEGADVLFRMLCFLPMLKLIFNITISKLRAERRNKDFSNLSVINTALVFAACVAGSYFFREKGMVLGYYAAYAITAILSFLVFRVNIFSKDAKPDKKEIKDIRSIAFVSMCNTSLSQLLYLLDLFVLGLVDPQETMLASYRVATIIPSALAFIPISLVTYLYPYFAENRNEPAWCLKRYKQILLGLGTFNMLLSAGLCLFAPIIIKLLFGEQYMDIVPLFRVLSLNYFFSGTFRVLAGNLLVTQRKLKFNFMVAVMSGIINIIADFIFISRWGPMGAALATVLVVVFSGILNTSYLFYIFKKKKK